MRMILLGLLAASVFPLQAKVKLPGFFSDNMVLQREAPVKIWGWADKNEPVQVRFNGQVKETKANRTGEWSILLDPMSAGGPYTLTVEGKDNRIDCGNILVGEVWLCSGQSNMEWIVTNSARADQEIADASNYPEIRALNVTKKMHCIPQTDFQGEWEVCSPETVGGFSAVAYFYARSLYRELGVPIGIINSSWGGTDIECWISPDAYAQLPDKIKIPYNQELIDAVHCSVEENNGNMEAYTEGFVYDKGMHQNWYAPDADDASWMDINMPNPWNEAPLVNTDGVVWFRGSFCLPESAKGPATLCLGQIDDNDICWINGTKVGSTKGWGIHRRYAVPENILKSGENSIVVRVTDEMGGGGFLATPEQFRIEWNEGEPVNVNLSGKWKYAQGVSDEDFRKMLLNPNNIHSLLYNAMIHPLVPMTIKGVIWYQGCSNAGQPHYYPLHKALIADWRARWNNPKMPFLIVQLAGFEPGRAKTWQTADATRVSGYALTRDIQQQMLNIPNVGLACAIDIGEAANIHPANKQDVGKRLALEAERIAYGMDVVSQGPLFLSASPEKGAIRVRFRNVDGGLKTSDGKAPGAFAIAGADKKFVWADAKIDGKDVLVSSPKVKDPKYVRYAYAGYRGDCNLQNREGLPAYPFRSDAYDYLSVK